MIKKTLFTMIQGSDEGRVGVYECHEGEEWKPPYYEFTADADVDADGANGQFGGRPAYQAEDRGSEYLANGGMRRTVDGRVIFSADWGREIVIMDNMGHPKLFDNGMIASKTAYRLPDFDQDNPEAYIDSETIPYIVLPPVLRARTPGVVLGCYAEATNMKTGQASPIPCMVADIGPRNKLGEVSIALARDLNIGWSPRHGGTDERIIRYRFWPGRQFTHKGMLYPLMPLHQ